MEFHERLRALRNERNETQVQVAKAIGLASRQYQRFDAGENLPSFETLIALSKHFEVSLDYLMCQTDER